MLGAAREACESWGTLHPALTLFYTFSLAPLSCHFLDVAYTHQTLVLAKQCEPTRQSLALLHDVRHIHLRNFVRSPGTFAVCFPRALSKLAEKNICLGHDLPPTYERSSISMPYSIW